MMQTHSQYREAIQSPFVVPHSKALKHSTAKRVVLASKHSPLQPQIANFIQSGFSKAYGATINVAMPYLVSIEQSNKCASLGFRGGHLPLFLEQYFSHAIEQHPFLQANNACRNNIVEIGHLYSNSCRLTLPLFMITALSLHRLGFCYLVFSATEKVKNILEHTGVELNYLIDACPTKLQHSTEHWGTYYQTNPKVYAVSLEKVVNTVQTSSYHKLHRQFLAHAVSEICEQYLTQLTNQHLSNQYLNK